MLFEFLEHFFALRTIDISFAFGKEIIFPNQILAGAAFERPQVEAAFTDGGNGLTKAACLVFDGEVHNKIVVLLGIGFSGAGKYSKTCGIISA